MGIHRVKLSSPTLPGYAKLPSNRGQDISRWSAQPSAFTGPYEFRTGSDSKSSSGRFN
jgi:hypothetical protein